MITPLARLEKLAAEKAAYAPPVERGRRHQTPQPVSLPVDFRHAGRHAAQKVTEDASAGKVPLTRAATDVMRDAVSAATKDQTGGEDAQAWMRQITGPAYRRVFDHQMKTAQPDIDSSDTQKLLQQYGKGVLGGLAAPSEAYAAKHGLLSKSSSAHATTTTQRATEKSAATSEAPIVQDEKSRKDEAALRNRHILLALKRALQGGAAGVVVGGLGASDEKKGQGALLGLLAGGITGAGVGAAEGGVKRAIGLDPLLQTIATARRP